MKILVIHTVYKQNGGEDSVVANEVKLLQSMQHEVELLKFTNAGNTLSKVIQLPFNYSAYRKTKQTIKSFNPDVVHIHNLHFAGSAAVIYAAKAMKVPVVMTLHNYRLLCASATLFFKGQHFTSSVNKAFSWKAITNGVYLNSKALTFWVNCSMLFHQWLKTYQQIDQFIIIGEYTREIFAKSKFADLTEKMVVKPNFCYEGAVLPEKPNLLEESYYLYVGRLSEEKGVDILLEAFAHSGLTIKIAGSGPVENLVIQYSQQYSNIQYLGSVDKEKVYELLSLATALIFPSKWYEPFGMVIIEAFSMGIPVIASNLGQLKYTIQDRVNGLHFTVGNAQDLAAKVSYYEKLSPAEKASYSNNALSTYQSKFSPLSNGEQLISIYQSAINAQL